MSLSCPEVSNAPSVWQFGNWLKDVMRLRCAGRLEEFEMLVKRACGDALWRRGMIAAKHTPITPEETPGLPAFDVLGVRMGCYVRPPGVKHEARLRVYSHANNSVRQYCCTSVLQHDNMLTMTKGSR